MIDRLERRAFLNFSKRNQDLQTYLEFGGYLYFEDCLTDNYQNYYPFAAE